MNEELNELFSKTLDELKTDHIVVVCGESNMSNVTHDCDTSIMSGQWDKFPKTKEYALEQTTKELEQAVEGMYHNLNVRAA